jgi:hypothetical protein
MNDNDRPINKEVDLEEFSIMELDERLEFVAWNDTNCNCGPVKTP